MSFSLDLSLLLYKRKEIKVKIAGNKNRQAKIKESLPTTWQMEILAFHEHPMIFFLQGGISYTQKINCLSLGLTKFLRPPNAIKKNV